MPNSFVRAKPSVLKFKEEYAYRFIVGSNPSAELAAAPKGEIEALTPFDGYETFSRDAIADSPSEQSTVQIGTVLLLPIPDPNLPPQPQKPDVFPLKISLPGGPKQLLSSDRMAARYSEFYEPGQPQVRPLKVDVRIFDERPAAYARIFDQLKEPEEGEASVPRAVQLDELVQRAAQEAAVAAVQAVQPPKQETLLQRTEGRLRRIFRSKTVSTTPPVAEKIAAKEEETELDARQQLQELSVFEKGVVVVFSLEIVWPKHLGEQVRSIVLRRAEIKWPHPVPHPDSIHLLAGEHGQAERRGNWRFNPAANVLEWEGMTALAPQTEEGTTQLRYKFPVMALKIDSPLDLYGQDELNARFEIEVQGALLSSRLPRLYDAAGQPVSLAEESSKATGFTESLKALGNPVTRVLGGNNDTGVPVFVRTRLMADVAVLLNDAFARRHFTPRWRLIFQGVRFDPMRFEDLKRTLSDLLFQVDREHLLEKPEPGCLLLARRDQPESGDKMELLVYCRGLDLAITQRETQVEGGVKLVTAVPTGDLEINLYGSARGDDRYLQEAFNSFALLLKQRFANVASLR
jgi:hypothetical protein